MSRASTTSSHISSPPNPGRDIPGSFPERTQSDPVVSSHKTLSEALYARRADYCRAHSVRIRVGTWNVAGKKGTENDVADWFVGGKGVATSSKITPASEEAGVVSGVTEDGGDGTSEADNDQSRPSQPEDRYGKTSIDEGQVHSGEEVGLYVLGLQEIVDINSATEALRPYTDSSASNRWKKQVQDALPRGYQLVAEQQLIGLLLLIYASPKVMPHVSSVSSMGVGTGLMGYMGNKGAVASRLVLGETTRLVFVNSHLSSGLGKAELDRRNWDAAQILSRTRFEPIVDSLGYVAEKAEKIGDEDFAFWFGDLNYRLEGIPGDDVRRLLMLHTRNEYDVQQEEKLQLTKQSGAKRSDSNNEPQMHHSRDASVSSSKSSANSSDAPSAGSDVDESDKDSAAGSLDGLDEPLDPSADPTSLQTTLDSLLPHDELRQQQRARKMFHDGWREGPITFLPTYKYDVGRVGLLDSSEKKRAPSWCDRILYRTRKGKTDYENMLVEEEEARKKDEELKAQGVDKAADDEDTLFNYDPEADGGYDEDLDGDAIADGEHTTRVVTKAGFEDVIDLEYYVSHQHVLSSDHKPLDAVFSLEYDAAMPQLKQRIHQEVVRDLDRAENEGRPTLTLVIEGQQDDKGQDAAGIEFGDVRFDEQNARPFTVANTGRATAEFGFVSRPIGPKGSMAPAPPWLSLHVELPDDNKQEDQKKSSKADKSSKEPSWSQDVSQAFFLTPGDATTIRLTAFVTDMKLVKQLNNAEAFLEDVLILRVRDGRDHFLPVRGFWQPSIYGRSIDSLVRVPAEGVRKFPMPTRPRSRKAKNLSEDGGDATKKDLEVADGQHNEITRSAAPVKFSVPPAFHRLTEAIEALAERTVGEWSMKNAPLPHSPAPQTPTSHSSATSSRRTSAASEASEIHRITLEDAESEKATDNDNRAIEEQQPTPPPWKIHSGWPFAPESWTSDQEDRKRLQIPINEVLDTHEQPILLNNADVLPPELSSLVKAEVLSQTLLSLLASLDDGIIPEKLWTRIENEFFPSKARFESNDDKRAAILEILSESSMHSVSFIIVTAMLARAAQEIASALQDSEPSQAEDTRARGRVASGLEGSEEMRRSNTTPPPQTSQSNKLGGLARRGTQRLKQLGAGRRASRQVQERQDPEIRAAAERRAIAQSYAAVFANVMIRVPEERLEKVKGTRAATALEEQKKESVEIFLDSNA